MRTAFVILALGLASNATAQTAETHPLSIEEITMHLFYEGSGVLSADIAADPDFIGWNTVIGEGAALEPANNLLIRVALRSDGHRFIGEDNLVAISVRFDDETQRAETISSVLTSDDGGHVIPIWMPNAGCAGTVTVDVRIRDQQETATVALECGE